MKRLHQFQWLGVILLLVLLAGTIPIAWMQNSMQEKKALSMAYLREAWLVLDGLQKDQISGEDSDQVLQNIMNGILKKDPLSGHPYLIDSSIWKKIFSEKSQVIIRSDISKEAGGYCALMSNGEVKFLQAPEKARATLP